LKIALVFLVQEVEVIAPGLQLNAQYKKLSVVFI